MAFPNTNPLPGDSEVVLLKKLLQLFGGSSTGPDGRPQLLSDILTAANAGGSGSSSTTFVDHGNTSGTITIDFDAGDYQNFNLTSDITFLKATNMSAGKKITLRLVETSSSILDINYSGGFSNDWVHVNTRKNEIQTDKTMIVVMEAWGDTDADITVLMFEEA
jgi:hypothetical protein